MSFCCFTKRLQALPLLDYIFDDASVDHIKVCSQATREWTTVDGQPLVLRALFHSPVQPANGRREATFPRQLRLLKVDLNSRAARGLDLDLQLALVPSTVCKVVVEFSSGMLDSEFETFRADSIRVVSGVLQRVQARLCHIELRWLHCPDWFLAHWACEAEDAPDAWQDLRRELWERFSENEYREAALEAERAEIMQRWLDEEEERALREHELSWGGLPSTGGSLEPAIAAATRGAPAAETVPQAATAKTVSQAPAAPAEAGGGGLARVAVADTDMFSDEILGGLYDAHKEWCGHGPSPLLSLVSLVQELLLDAPNQASQLSGVRLVALDPAKKLSEPGVALTHPGRSFALDRTRDRQGWKTMELHITELRVVRDSAAQRRLDFVPGCLYCVESPRGCYFRRNLGRLSQQLLYGQGDMHCRLYIGSTADLSEVLDFSQETEEFVYEGEEPSCSGDRD